MVYDVISNKKISIPEDTNIKIGNEFVVKETVYIITLIQSNGYIEVCPKEEYIKRITCKKCEDGIIRTLKEIEDFNLINNKEVK